jgi:hypothetical protein
MGIAGGSGAKRPEASPRFLSQSWPVDGHSIGRGAPNALFTANSARQFCPWCPRPFARPGCPSRPPVSRTSSRPRPRLGARSAARLGCNAGEDVREGQGARPAPQDDARAPYRSRGCKDSGLPFCRFLRMLGSLHGNRRFGTGRHVLRMIVLLRARGTVLLWH